MTSAVGSAIVAFLYVLVACVIVRALISWFPVSPRNDFVRMLDRVTQPLLDPARRLIPTIGMIDLSAFVTVVALMLMISVVRQATG